MRSKKKTKLLLVALLIMISLGYAILTANLNINGFSIIGNSSWDIHFENVNVKEGSVEIETGDQAATINPNDNTEVTYSVHFNKPGDYYDFKVDAKNDGSIDGMVELVTSTMKIGDNEPVVINNNLPAYLSYKAVYSDDTPILPNQYLKAGEKETYWVRIEYKKDITASDLPSTAQSIEFSFKVKYKQADSNAEERTIPEFADDSWETIVNNIKNDTIPAHYTVGATHEIDLGTLGTHPLRIANTTTPNECSTPGFSQTACGFVLEFADVVAEYYMNSTSTNVGGWPASSMRTYVNDDIYNAIPTVLKNAIIDTTVVSGHGSTSGETNFTSTDKLYLLSTHEIWEDVDGNPSSGIDYYDTGYNSTRQLDYYSNLGVTTSNYSASIKQKNGSDYYWWLRVANSNYASNFNYVHYNGHFSYNAAHSTGGVSPAFRIG